MTYRLTGSDCPDGPCPKLATDDARGMTALQGYDPEFGPASLDEAMGPQPAGEPRIEMASARFEGLLARHLTDEAIARILALRAEMGAAV